MDAEALPDELWDHILNGVCSRGVPLLHPTARFWPRQVCARWKAIIEDVSDTRRERLALVWHGVAPKWMLDPNDDARSRAWSDAFCSGRLLAPAGLLPIVYGPDWYPPLLDTRPGAVGEHYLTSVASAFRAEAERTRRIERSSSAVDGVSEAMARLDGCVAEMEPRFVADVHNLWSIRNSSDALLDEWRDTWRATFQYLAAHGADASYDEFDPYVYEVAFGRLVRALVTFGYHDEAFCLTVYEHGGGGGGNDDGAPGQPHNIDAFVSAANLAAATIYAERDNVHLFLRAMSEVVRMYDPTGRDARSNFIGEKKDMMDQRKVQKRSLQAIWSALARTGSTASISVLVDLMSDAPSEGALERESAASDQHARGAPRLSRAPHLRKTLEAARKRGVRLERVTASVQADMWQAAMLHGPHVLPVLLAHGLVVEHVRAAIIDALSGDRQGLADALVDMVRTHRSREDVENVFVQVLHHCRDLDEAVAWALRHGYSLAREDHAALLMLPDACHARDANDFNPRRDRERTTHTILLTLVRAWPDVLVHAPTVIRRTVERMLDYYQIDSAIDAIAALSPLLWERVTGRGAATDGSDGPDQDGVPRRNDGNTTWEHSSSSSSIWDSIANGSNRSAAWALVRSPGMSEPEIRVRALGQLIKRCDPASEDPALAAAWRWVCGTPRPVRPTAHEQEVLLLHSMGFLVP